MSVKALTGVVACLAVVALVLCIVACVIPNWHYRTVEDGTDTKEQYGLWEYCNQTKNDTLNQDTTVCYTWDDLSNDTCESYLIATRAFSFIGMSFIVITVCAAVAAMGTKSGGAQVLLACAAPFAFVTATLCWVMWMIFAETICSPDFQKKLNGYSAAFILQCSASGLMFLALICTCFAFVQRNKQRQLEKTRQVEPHVEYIPPPASIKSAPSTAPSAPSQGAHCSPSLSPPPPPPPPPPAPAPASATGEAKADPEVLGSTPLVYHSGMSGLETQGYSPTFAAYPPSAGMPVGAHPQETVSWYYNVPSVSGYSVIPSTPPAAYTGSSEVPLGFGGFAPVATPVYSQWT